MEAFLATGIRRVSLTEISVDDSNCPICYQSFLPESTAGVATSASPTKPEDPVRILSCGHIFGKQCLTELVNLGAEYSQDCPKCRRRLFADDTSAPPPHVVRTPTERLRQVETDTAVIDLVLECGRVYDLYDSAQRLFTIAKDRIDDCLWTVQGFPTDSVVTILIQRVAMRGYWVETQARGQELDTLMARLRNAVPNRQAAFDMMLDNPVTRSDSFVVLWIENMPSPS